MEQFSPRSRAILEIQSRRDLEILEKIYANSVLLGDDGPDGWGIKYKTEFHMTGDSKLFPPRPDWEAKGYRPDEYSRWLKGDWRPIEELWAELGVDPDKPAAHGDRAGGVGCSIRALAPSAARRKRSSCTATCSSRVTWHGRTRRSGVPSRRMTRLPVPRVTEIPPGIILSRDGNGVDMGRWRGSRMSRCRCTKAA